MSKYIAVFQAVVRKKRNKSCQRTSSPAKSIGGNLHRFFSGLGASEANVKIDVL